MSCIANRVRAGWGSWLEVIDNIPHFSAEQNMPTGTPSIWDANFVRLLHEVEAIFDGSQDYAKKGVYWCDSRRVETEFFKEKILSQPQFHKRTCDMGTLMTFS